VDARNNKEHPNIAAAIVPQLRQTQRLTRMVAEPLGEADQQDERWDHEGEEA
jgi:hypothetical protein